MPQAIISTPTRRGAMSRNRQTPAESPSDWCRFARAYWCTSYFVQSQYRMQPRVEFIMKFILFATLVATTSAQICKSVFCQFPHFPILTNNKSLLGCNLEQECTQYQKSCVTSTSCYWDQRFAHICVDEDQGREYSIATRKCWQLTLYKIHNDVISEDILGWCTFMGRLIPVKCSWNCRPFRILLLRKTTTKNWQNSHTKMVLVREFSASKITSHVHISVQIDITILRFPLCCWDHLACSKCNIPPAFHAECRRLWKKWIQVLQYWVSPNRKSNPDTAFENTPNLHADFDCLGHLHLQHSSPSPGFTDKLHCNPQS